MPSNRIDQVAVPGVLKNHEQRIRVLEAVAPPTIASLPPWFDWSPELMLPEASVGVQTPPGVYLQFAELMVQTQDGTPLPDGGTPLLGGTMLGETKVELSDGGTIGSGYNLVPRLLLQVSSHPDAYNPVLEEETTGPEHTIGTGWIRQYSTNTLLAVQLSAAGELMVPNVPDTADLTGAADYSADFLNMCRLANPYVSPAIPAFPWVWANGDWISVTYQSPMEVD